MADVYNWDETPLLEEKQTCYDQYYELDDVPIKTHLSSDIKDKILILEKPEENKPIRADCFSRSILKTTMNDPNMTFYECKSYSLSSESVMKDTVYVLISVTSLGNILLKKRDIILQAITKPDNYTLILEKVRDIPKLVSLGVMEHKSDMVSAKHCQDGSGAPLYKIWRCGGDKCLRDIFKVKPLPKIESSIETKPKIELNKLYLEKIRCDEKTDLQEYKNLGIQQQSKFNFDFKQLCTDTPSADFFGAPEVYYYLFIYTLNEDGNKIIKAILKCKIVEQRDRFHPSMGDTRNFDQSRKLQGPLNILYIEFSNDMTVDSTILNTMVYLIRVLCRELNIKSFSVLKRGFIYHSMLPSIIYSNNLTLTDKNESLTVTLF